MRKLITTAILGALLGMLAACSTTKVEPTATVEDRNANPAQKPGDATSKPVTPTNIAGNPLTDPNNVLSKRSVYFEYDKYDIQDKFKSLVEAHAKFLGSHQDRKVLIQGNCDERGSREYNLALGQKRADAVKKALTLLGARDAQIESVSLGEEKPRALGKDEASYAENRRGDILYNGEY